MLEIPDTLEIQMVIAIGKPKEQIVVTELDDGASIQYWRDENSVHYVPKRKLNDIIVKKYENDGWSGSFVSLLSQAIQATAKEAH